ncbi:MAG: hypothetical protein ACO3JL_15840 [Myxococcota bacterium]
MPITLRDKSLQRAFEKMIADDRVTRPEVEELARLAKDWLGVSPRERADLKQILAEAGDRFDPEAREALQAFLDTGRMPAPKPPIAQGTNPTASRYAADVTDIQELASTFAREMAERGQELSTPEAAFAVFAQYGGKLRALGAAVDPRVVDEAAEKLLEAGRNSPAKGYDAKDTDHDTRSDLYEAARGTNPDSFDVRDEEVGRVWTTTYWPMAGSGGNDQAGSPTSHLWARSGPLDKLDQLLRARGMEAEAKAMSFERKPALGWLIGERDNGHMINRSRLLEVDAEASTGIDFDGDGKITDGVRVDFLGADGNFAAVGRREDLVPRATIDGEVRDIRRERITGDDGAVSFRFFRQDTGAELSDVERKSLFYANPTSGDGKVDGNLDVGWWGSCDKVALAGVLFKEPLKDVVSLDGVEFTRQDILGLLTVIADSQADGTDFIGHRYDNKPDLLVLQDGTQLRGKLVNVDTAELRGGQGMWRWDGDFMVVSDPAQTDPTREFTFREADGTERTVKASEVKHLAREDAQDISPLEFHTTVLQWLGEGRAAAMDRDSGDHVWNYSFHGATLKSATPLQGDSRPKEAGHNGPVAADTNVVAFEMDVRFGESNTPRAYRYWLEFDSAGKAVNGGWTSDNPDFLWRPAGFRNFTGTNDRNPFVKPELVKEIYEQFRAVD